MKTKDDFDGLVNLVKEQIPKFEIKEKKDSWFQKVLGFVLWPINRTYMTNYTSVMFGKMYLPEDSSSWTYNSLYEILRHEFIHLLDAKKYPVLFEVSYLLCLPFIFTMRSFWELRGFTQSMLVEFENSGDISDSTIDWVLRQFTSSRYGWMCPFKTNLRRHLQQIRTKIITGEIAGTFYPHADKNK